MRPVDRFTPARNAETIKVVSRVGISLFESLANLGQHQMHSE